MFSPLLLKDLASVSPANSLKGIFLAYWHYESHSQFSNNITEVFIPKDVEKLI